MRSPERTIRAAVNPNCHYRVLSADWIFFLVETKLRGMHILHRSGVWTWKVYDYYTTVLTLLTIIATYLRVWLNKPHVGSPETTHAVYPVSECETQFICAVIQVTGYYWSTEYGFRAERNEGTISRSSLKRLAKTSILNLLLEAVPLGCQYVLADPRNRNHRNQIAAHLVFNATMTQEESQVVDGSHQHRWSPRNVMDENHSRLWRAALGWGRTNHQPDCHHFLTLIILN